MSEDDDFEPRPPRRWGLLGAVLALLVVGAAWILWPSSYDVVECGAIGPASDAAALPADGFCTLSGNVTGDLVLSMGKVQKGDTPAERYRGVRFITRLGETNVFVLLSGSRPDVAELYDRENDLAGLEVAGTGRIFDPDPLPGYRGTARGIRKLFGLPEGAPVRLFDVGATPE